MTVSDIIVLIPGFAGLALSLFLLWRTELRQARMSLRLLAPPDSWTVNMARRTASVQAPEPAEADLLLMHGIFPLSATNDGPRGGALWNIASWVDGLGAWRLRSFDPGQQMPYALPGRSCEAWTRTAISIACDFETLGEGLRELQQIGDITFHIACTRQGWRGRIRRKSTSLQMSRAAVLAGLREGARFVDLQTCQVVPRCRALAAERFAAFDLPHYEIDILTKWALRRDPIEYVTVPDGSPDRLKIAVRHPSGQIDQAWTVGAGRTKEVLGHIIEGQHQLVSEVQELREAAVQI